MKPELSDKSDSQIKIENLSPFGVKIDLSCEIEIGTISQEKLEQLVEKEKLVLVRGARTPSQDEFLAFCRGFNTRPLLEWNFGPVMNLVEQSCPENYLFSRESVPYHWDGAFHKVPTYLVFSCVEAPDDGCGGETLFCNTERVYAASSLEQKAQFASISLTYETEKVAHYGGSFASKLVNTHPVTGATTLRFAEPVATELNPVSLTVHGIAPSQQTDFIETLTRQLYDERFMYRHTWKTGDLLIADNHALVHGRTAFASNTPRHLRRIQLL